MKLTLVPIHLDGSTTPPIEQESEFIQEVREGTAQLFSKVAYEAPWIAYFALDEAGVVVGTCAFKGPPENQRVEIAYYTFTENENRGIGTAMAAELVKIARKTDPSLIIAAQTLPRRNASQRILEKNGFKHVLTLDHPDDGTVYEWRVS